MNSLTLTHSFTHLFIHSFTLTNRSRGLWSCPGRTAPSSTETNHYQAQNLNHAALFTTDNIANKSESNTLAILTGYRYIPNMNVEEHLALN